MIIKPSTSKEFGEFIGKKSRAEVYTYDPMNKEVGDKVAKLNATLLEKGKIHSYLLDEGSSYSQDAKDDRVFPIASQEIVVQKKEDGFYEIEIDKPLIDEKKKQADEEVIKLLLDDLLSQIWEKNPGLEVHPFKNII